MPLFRERYNQWNGGEYMGYWEGDVFVAVRPASVNEAVDPAVKFGYEVGELMAGDDEHRSQCSFMISAAAPKSPDDAWLTYIEVVHRQDDDPQALALHAVDHQAQLLRFFDQAEARAAARNAE